ncbi:alpha-L-rhamnosidase [Rhizosphaericola mali]|nr:alpha-L-rhamnosidase [Rhizosphaericola mali]
MNYLKKINILFLFIFSIQNLLIAQKIKITDLKCEYLTIPIGIDNTIPRFSWKINSKLEDINQKCYRIVVGTDSLAVSKGKGNSWCSLQMHSNKNLITYKGNPLQPFTKYFWKIIVWTDKMQKTISSVSSFEMGMLSPSDWKGAWISDGEDKDLKFAPYFRKVFNVTKSIKSARAYITAAGLSETYINGEKIGNHELEPMFTRYDRRNLYVTYDITNQINNGANAIGVILGNGWYNFQSQAVWDYDHAPWRNRPAFCMEIHITYTDGSKENIYTDRDWKTSSGPIVYNSIYTGEHYDSRLEQVGWNTISFNDKNWKNASYRKAPGQYISAQSLEPIRYVELIKPIACKKINDSDYIYDIGRNISGVTSLKISGDSGTVVKVIHAERLDKNGNLDLSNIDYFLAKNTKIIDPFATDIYVLNGKKEQTFRPHFNYKGFQYVEVKSNNPISITKDNLSAYFMHSDVSPIGKIHTSNNIINKIYAATNASYLSNLFGYPTDCPQREKNGWTGDAHIAIETGLYNFDAITIYEKWLQDMRDEQQPNGTLPSIVPTDGWGYEWGNGPDWTSAIAIIPWNIYLFYGDDKILRDNYDNIKRYVDRVTTTAPDGLTSWGLGDWIPVKSKTPVEFTSSIYYYVDVDILTKMSKLFGYQKDYNNYSQLKVKIKKAINYKFLNKVKSTYGEGFQTELAVPLYWGIVPENLKKAVAANLANKIKENKFHLDVGLLGTKAILSALSENGQAETAYKLASQKEYPSWGWWMVNGASTLYENWNIDQQRDLSLNHIMFGEIGAWLYKGLGGIQPDEALPGFKNVLLRPKFVDGLNEFYSEHIGPYGKIISAWKKDGNEIIYNVTIPHNSTAKVYFSMNQKQCVYLNNKKIRTDHSYKIKSGYYNFYIK